MTFEHRSKHRLILFGIAIIFLLIGIGFLLWQRLAPGSAVSCTTEAKLCFDGSSVGRTGPRCEFAPCPKIVSLSNFGNSQIERALTDYLLTQKQFSWKTRADSFVVCGVDNLDSVNGLFPLSIWAYCGEFVIERDTLVSLSGSSGPIKVNYPNELSYYDPSRFTHEAPGDGARYAEDIKRLFPDSVQTKILSYDGEELIRRVERFAFANMRAWESIKTSIDTCKVERVFQAHDRTVEVTLKNGEIITAIEPILDDVFDIVNEATDRCGRIVIAIE